MHQVTCRWIWAQPTTLNHVKPAPVLLDESPRLFQKFHRELRQSPEGFRSEVAVEGFPLIRVEWEPCGHTAGALLFPPFIYNAGRLGPEVVSLLLNGVESPEDLRILAKRCRMPPEKWQAMLDADKPIAYNLLFNVGRLREPATVTIVNSFANAFFSLFGTNEVEDALPGYEQF